METSARIYKKALGLILVVIIVGGFYLLFQNRWELRDRFVARDYVASESSEEVRTNLNLSLKGDLVYRASLTEVDGKEKFKEKCPVTRFEEANVLGCYSKQRIYVLEVDEPKLKGVEEVTAAHELLHAQFERMSPKERSNLYRLLDELELNLADDDVRKLLKSYQDQLGKGEDLYNEMFAIFGTQLELVGPDLETIYDDYFKDRLKLVGLYRSYSGEFKRLQESVSNFDIKLSELRKEKEQLEVELSAESQELEVEKSRLDALAESGSESYREAALAYNSEVEAYNARVKRIQKVVEDYNRTVEERNALALSVKNLQDELNANVTER